MSSLLPTTTAPFTYLIDYGHHLNDSESFIARVADAPPYLLHVGHNTPFDNSWGAFPEYTAEEGPFPARLTAMQMWERLTVIRQYVDRLHAVGVQKVIPYICNQTLGGNPASRTGIWETYDHWEEYREFGFGDKPATDPLDWLTRERNGRVHYNYQKHHPYFTRFGFHRYAPCQNNPDYRRYQHGIVTSVVMAGYDGVFVDNNAINCYCRHCQEKFRAYVAGKYSAGEIAARFGVDDVAELAMGYRGSPMELVKTDPDFLTFLTQIGADDEMMNELGVANPEEAWLEEMGNFWLGAMADAYRHQIEQRLPPAAIAAKFGTPDASLWGIRTPEERALWAETKLFRARSVADNLAMIRQIGRSLREDFLVVPNWGPMQQLEGNGLRLMEQWGHDIRVWAPHCDCIMLEEFSDPGMIAHGFYFDFLPEYKFGFANRIKPGNLNYITRKETVELAYAEATAGGGGYYIHSIQDRPGYPEIRAKYQAFFQEHAALLEGYHSYADVALAFCYDQMHLENAEHLRQVYKLTRYLADQHILFDYLLEDDLAGDRLSGYKVLLLSELRYMNDAQIAGVERFVADGGILILTGETGRYGSDGKPRVSGGFAALMDGGVRDEHGILTAVHGGRCVHSLALSSLLPADHFSREDAINTPALLGMSQTQYDALAILDKGIGVDRYQDGGILLGCMASGRSQPLAVADPYQGVGVRFNAYMKVDGSRGSLVLHAVNYNLPLPGVIRDDRIIPVENLPVQLAVPENWSVQAARAITPGQTPVSVPYTIEAGCIRCILPAFTFYQLMEFTGVTMA